MPRNPKWRREELILALDLYLRRGLLDDTDPSVIELSGVLRRLGLHPSPPDPVRFRNPNGVAMKLANFAAINPDDPRTALTRGGALEDAIWQEFAQDRARLEREATALRQSVAAAT
jgi:5-methylcytosine-specific restriction protein A